MAQLNLNRFKFVNFYGNRSHAAKASQTFCGFLKKANHNAHLLTYDIEHPCYALSYDTIVSNVGTSNLKLLANQLFTLAENDHYCWVVTDQPAVVATVLAYETLIDDVPVNDYGLAQIFNQLNSINIFLSVDGSKNPIENHRTQWGIQKFLYEADVPHSVINHNPSQMFYTLEATKREIGRRLVENTL